MICLVISGKYHIFVLVLITHESYGELLFKDNQNIKWKH